MIQTQRGSGLGGLSSSHDDSGARSRRVLGEAPRRGTPARHKPSTKRLNSILAHVSGTWIAELEIHRDVVPGVHVVGKGQAERGGLEANAKGPAALLINLYAAPTQSTGLCQGLRSFATVQRATEQGFRASSLTPQTKWEDKEEIKQFSSV